MGCGSALSGGRLAIPLLGIYLDTALMMSMTIFTVHVQCHQGPFRSNGNAIAIGRNRELAYSARGLQQLSSSSRRCQGYIRPFCAECVGVTCARCSSGYSKGSLYSSARQCGRYGWIDACMHASHPSIHHGLIHPFHHVGGI